MSLNPPNPDNDPHTPRKITPKLLPAIPRKPVGLGALWNKVNNPKTPTPTRFRQGMKSSLSSPSLGRRKVMTNLEEPTEEPKDGVENSPPVSRFMPHSTLPNDLYTNTPLLLVTEPEEDEEVDKDSVMKSRSPTPEGGQGSQMSISTSNDNGKGVKRSRDQFEGAEAQIGVALVAGAEKPKVVSIGEISILRAFPSVKITIHTFALSPSSAFISAVLSATANSTSNASRFKGGFKPLTVSQRSGGMTDETLPVLDRLSTSSHSVGKLGQNESTEISASLVVAQRHQRL
ncbi:hypothetical protein DFH27DRAFT_616441 [Peziza echinospora]|nr:hypothetical protein DFH27DRAFT_616441 [Peziza echinospora]